ncbi:hypothetical protein [Desulfofustis limnaeus]|uniref:hypothetical protein n=1 Tax=Desulfofustis limnaeus TaxID=2740163 RepID=UPI0024DF87B1|nr:hypothetical protein [Desulfofustis limnaeus]
MREGNYVWVIGVCCALLFLGVSSSYAEVLRADQVEVRVSSPSPTRSIEITHNAWVDEAMAASRVMFATGPRESAKLVSSTGVPAKIIEAESTPIKHSVVPDAPDTGYEPLFMLLLGVGMVGFSEFLRRTVAAR